MNNSEHLSSVHDNPIMREFGIKTALSRHDTRGHVRKSSVDSLSTADNDSEQEYHVNSGFVTKLRSKFNQLQNDRSHKVTLSRKSASLENLLDAGNYSSYGLKNQRQQRNASHDDSKIHSIKDSGVELRKKPVVGLRVANRPRSNDEKSLASAKPPVFKKKDTEYSTQNHFTRSGTKPPLPKKRGNDITIRQSRNSASDSTKHKIEHHDWKVAPDLEKIGRDDIVIIESSSPGIRRKNDNVEQPRVEKAETPEKEEYRHVKPLREKSVDENELPKPNTVSAFRSLFESTKTASDVIGAWKQSQTKTSAGPESPSVSSPIGTPRSPLVKMNEENVFENSYKTPAGKEFEKEYTPSPRSLSSDDSNSAQQSPRNSTTSEITQNVDTSSTSRKKSFDVFQRNTNDKPSNITVSSTKQRSSYTESDDNSSSSPTTLSPRLPSNLVPVHPLSNIFDSSSVMKKDKSNKPKPVVIARKPSIPKDTIELKHEADQKKKANLPKLDIKQVTERSPDKNDADLDTSASKSFNESSANYSGRNNETISPRQTKIFDSSNIVKNDRPSPTEKQFRSSPVNEQSGKVSPIINQDLITKPEIIQVELNGDSTKPQSGVKLVKTTIAVRNEPSIKQEKKPEKLKMPMLPQEDVKKEPGKQRTKPADNKTAPTSGMSSYLANKLKKTTPDSNGQSSALTNGSSSSPVPRKRQAPSVPLTNGTDKLDDKEEESPPPLPATPEPDVPKSNIDDIIKRKKKKAQAATKMVFDSSKIVKKKKETPKRKPRKTIEELNRDIRSEPAVPLLDLTSITNDKLVMDYQEGYIPTEIKPCPIVFVGAEVVFAVTPYKKNKKRGANLKFDDTATKTFEYEAEASALEAYLQEHPEERADAKRQAEEEEGDVSPTQVRLTQDLLNDGAPESADTSSMKSNTVIGITSSGALTNYKSKYQVEDFQFGQSSEPDIYMGNEYETSDDVEDQGTQLLPADESELDTFSAETGKADLLF